MLALVRVGARRGRVPTRPHGRNPLHFTLVADLNAQDDDGLGWSVLADARDPSRVQPGAMLLAGNRSARAVVRVVAIDDDGPVHFVILPGSVTKNRHLVDRTPS